MNNKNNQNYYDFNEDPMACLMRSVDASKNRQCEDSPPEQQLSFASVQLNDYDNNKLSDNPYAIFSFSNFNSSKDNDLLNNNHDEQDNIQINNEFQEGQNDYRSDEKENLPDVPKIECPLYKPQ